MSISIAGIGLPNDIINIIQDRTLERVFHDALFPRLLYRSEATAEIWPANLGDSMTFSRAGLMQADTTPLVPGTDPMVGTYPFEQWEVTANQYGKSADTHMPTSYVTLAPKYLRDIVVLGLNAGETMNRLARNPLYRAYNGGNTNVTTTAAIGATSINVASLAGFTNVIADARIVPVSPAHPLAVTFTGSTTANTVVGASPNDLRNPFGPGTLFLGAPLAGANLTVTGALRPGVFAENSSRITRSGGGTTVDALTTADTLVMQNIITTVAGMRANNVPPTPDGTYHVHLTPAGEAQLFADPVFQRLHQSLPDSVAYRDFAIGRLNGCTFYRNTENPNTQNSGTLVSTGTGGSALGSGEIGGDVVNQAGVPINREIVLGGGTMYEKFIDESKYITEAGVQGKIGEFSVINNGVQVMIERVRLILRAPQDRLQQVVSSAWSWSGDFGIPSDATTGSPARFKRAAIIEHA